MSDTKTSGLDRELEQERRELRQSLDRTLETTIREAWLANAAVWVGVTVGAFVLNLLLLVLVTGG